MTVLQRTDLTTSQKIQCAAAAVAGQHEHGSKTALSETYEISRPTVYAVGATAESVLRSHFEAPLLGGAGVRVRVDDAQLRRAVVALRVMAPNAIRPIEDLLPLRYPGVRVSYGTIQSMFLLEPVRLVVSAGEARSVLVFRPAAQEEVGVVKLQLRILGPGPEVLDVKFPESVK